MELKYNSEELKQEEAYNLYCLLSESSQKEIINSIEKDIKMKIKSAYFTDKQLKSLISYKIRLILHIKKLKIKN